MDGKVLDEAGVIAVAKLPGKQELLTMLCMALMATSAAWPWLWMPSARRRRARLLN